MASGEATKPGLNEPTSTAVATPTADEDLESPSPTGDVDEGFFSGIEGLASSSTWMAAAGGIVVLAGAGIGAFFFFRSRRQRRDIFGLANNGEGARGDYAPVGDDVPMGLLERGRRKFGGGGGSGQGSKELYDAFGDGPSDSEDELIGEDEPTALRYHDEFLGDEEDEDGEEGASRGVQGGYRDDVDDEIEGVHEEGQETGASGSAGGSGSGSSGSWEDAGEQAQR